jgi:hypothetical protein
LKLLEAFAANLKLSTVAFKFITVVLAALENNQDLSQVGKH